MCVTNNKSVKYLPYLAMLSMTIKLITVIMIYKITNIFGFNISVSTLIIPLWFVIGDIIAEIYGYKVARNLIICTVLLQILFGIIISAFSLMHHANVLDNKVLYDNLFLNMMRVSVASSIGLIIGGVYNAFLMVYIRDKVLPKASFMIRSIIASSISEILFTVVVYVIEFHNIISTSSTFKLILVSFLFKQLISPILIIVMASPIVFYIRKNTSFQDVNNTNIIEIYTDAISNKSKFRECEINLGINHPLGQYSDNINVKDMMFRKFPAGLTFEMHVAPSKQYIIYLDGEVEVTTSSGQTRLFKAGDILLASDTTGMGHISKTIKPGKSIIVRV